VEKGAARQAWIQDGGLERDFKREWPRLRDQSRKQRVIAADKSAREAHRMSRHSRI
jgi:hypothetical protein